MKKRILAAIIILTVILVAVAVWAGIINRPESRFIVENGDDGTIYMTAENAGKDVAGTGYITIEDGQIFNVQSNLTDNSTIIIEVMPMETDATTDVLLEEAFSAIDNRNFEFPTGKYVVRITAKKGASGTMEIKPEGSVEREEVSDVDILTGNPEAGTVTAYAKDGSEVVLTENTDGTYLTGDGITYYLGTDDVYRARGEADLYVNKHGISDKRSSDVITEEQALDAIKKYCFSNDPGLADMINSEDYTAYFDVSANDVGEIVVLYRSYTTAQIRYYIDPFIGDVYVTELVPGIIDEEQRTDESFNINDYIAD